MSEHDAAYYDRHFADRAAAPKVPAMTEAELQRLVTDAAVLYGWHWAHFRPAQTSRGWRTPVSGTIGQGFPDLVLIRPRDHRVMLVELKAQRGKVSESQAFVHDILTQAGLDVRVVRPDTVDDLFRALA